MILAKTLRDIAKESRLNKAEKKSLRLIATDVAKLEKMQKTDKNEKTEPVSRPYPEIE